MNLYHIIYSLFYSLSQKMNGRDSAPIYNACLGLSIIILLNAVTVFLMVDFIFGSDFFIKIDSISKSYFVFYNLGFFCANYIYFKIRKVPVFEGAYFFGRYVAAVSLAAIYVVASVLLFGVMMFVGFNARQGG